MGGFSRVTNFLRDVLMQSDTEDEMPSGIPEELNEDIPGMEISNLDEPGYEFVTKVGTGAEGGVEGAVGNEDIPGMEISNLDEPGYEFVTKMGTGGWGEEEREGKLRSHVIFHRNWNGDQ